MLLFEVVKRYDVKQLVTFLREKNLGLKKKEYKIFHRERVNGHQFLLLTREKLLANPYKFPRRLTEDLAEFIDELNKQKEALSCVPLPIRYHSNVITSQATTYSGDQFPTEIHIWGSFWGDIFEEVNKFHFDNEPKFKRSQFGNFSSCINEEDIRNAFYYNICQVLNILLPDYDFSRQSVPIVGVPDFFAMFGTFKFIALIEIKREHSFQLLLLNGEQTFLYFDEISKCYEINEHARDVIQQTFTYMAEAQLQYSTLPIQSQSSPVLKTYAYMVQVLCTDSFSRDHVITTDKRKRQSVSYSEITTKSTKKGKMTVIASKKKQSSSIHEKSQISTQNLSFADFKYKRIHIPNLLCYGFYSRMYYAIGMTLVGSTLNNYKHITEWQKVMDLLALNAIHKRGILHNDIHEKNILLDDTNDAVYLIDFGMARYHCDAKKSWRLFDEEKRKLICLLDHYTLLDRECYEVLNQKCSSPTSIRGDSQLSQSSRTSVISNLMSENYFDFGKAVFKRYKELNLKHGKDGSQALVKSEIREAVPEAKCSDKTL
ncbi:kinase-like domain-containing protein [Rhizophagus clarus]|uniref:Kinase-like domain-containing protein n=1 Tax=Rhizophagus clarus TaxID=94130 RepID=A0A8H3QM89_9GLOM|nr:kinase-like domain-containing protein [Rhizophagus clarus]